MNELQEMQNRITQLEQETNALREALALKAKSKAQTLRQRFVVGLAIAGVGLALTTHNGNTQATVKGQAPIAASETISCRYLKIVDAKGNMLVSLGSTKDREGQISIYNGGAERIVTISATTDTGEGAVWINDNKGKSAASLRSQGSKGILWTQK